MFKKGFFFVILLITSFGVFSVFDLGVLSQFTVTAAKLSAPSDSTGAQMTVISHEEIEKLHAESTADVLKTVSGIDFNSYGALGSAQCVSIRGFGSSRTSVFINGSSVVSAHDTSFDFSQIPVSSIDRIEIVSSGAAGGIINIITEHASSDSIELSFENGSFLPGTAGLKTLVDSQKMTLSSSKTINNTKLFAFVGFVRASNNYTYEKSGGSYVRNNAGMWAVNGIFNYSSFVGKTEIKSDNILNYQHSCVPGSLTYPSSDDYQNAFLFSTVNSIVTNNLNIGLTYSYNPLFYHDNDYSDSEHKRHMADFSVACDFSCNEKLSLKPYANLSLNYVKSTDYDFTSMMRVSPKAGLSACLSKGNFRFYPLAEISYVSDMKKSAPSFSATFEYSFNNNLCLSFISSYAVKLPSFSDMYWKDETWYKGNPDLQPEKSVSGDFCIDYSNNTFVYSADFFVKNYKDAIVIKSDYSSMDNLAKAFYLGFDQNFSVKTEGFSFGIGWLFNKSFDLSSSDSLSYAKSVDYVRKNTVTVSLGYDFGRLEINADAKYLGKYSKGGLIADDSNVFIVNAGIDFSFSKGFSMYLKADNLFNVSYELSPDYPMPGLKIRMGGSWRVK